MQFRLGVLAHGFPVVGEFGVLSGSGGIVAMEDMARGTLGAVAYTGLHFFD